MQLNEGRFAMNGRCGYVLQPECMRNPKYNPFDKQTLANVDPITLGITVSNIEFHFQVVSLILEILQNSLFVCLYTCTFTFFTVFRQKNRDI